MNKLVLNFELHLNSLLPHLSHFLTRHKMAVEDAQVAHKQAHEACAHATSRCECAYCEDGKCLEDNLFTVHDGVASRILCDKEAGASDFKYDCVKGVCDCEYGAKNTALTLA